MRFMVIHKADEHTEAGELPDTQMLTDMGRFNEELVKAGVMRAGDGLQPTSRGARVRLSENERTAVRGPFADPRQLIAGFWIWECASLQEAIDWVKRCPVPAGREVEIEIRQIYEAADFGEALTPELQQAEEKLRVQVEAQQRAAAEPAAPPAAAEAAKLFVNLPVKDVKRSIEFFGKLGYRFNSQFTDDKAACMVIGEDNYAMLVSAPFFETFTPRPIADAKQSTEALVSLSAPSRADVDRIVETALAAGASRSVDAQDHGFMYERGFADPDGHIWTYFWMDPAHLQS